MKQKVFTLLGIIFTCITACKKDNTGIEVRQFVTAENALPVAASANPPIKVTGLISATLRIKLAADPINTDDILIVFKANSKPTFVINEDAPVLQGFGLVNLASFSSDNIALSINQLPLPTQSLGITLRVNGKKDAAYNLSMTGADALPPLFQIWLKDNYLKDSVDFRNNPNYTFNITNTDTATYGSHRFRLVISQDKALSMSLLNFKAVKAPSGALVSWGTANEFNYTRFTVERSVNNSHVFYDLDTIMSSGISTYSFLDNAPITGTDYYRLKMEDLNGVITYSDLIPVTYL